MDDNAATLNQLAIDAAISSHWEEALTLNQQIIALEPSNIDALNRLARAFFELGNFTDSKKYYQLSLKTDPYNQIAAKFLKRIEAFNKHGQSETLKKMLTKSNGHTFSPDLFIEEPGKTKVVSMLKVAEPQRLSLLSSGDEVVLVAKARGVCVTDLNGEYLGVVPDDVSFQLLRLLKGGNKYKAYVKTIKTNGLSILIREVHRSSRFKNQPSFLDSVNTMTYSSDHINLMDDNETTDDEAEEEGTI